jgi:hypothetical protein
MIQKTVGALINSPCSAPFRVAAINIVSPIQVKVELPALAYPAKARQGTFRSKKSLVIPSQIFTLTRSLYFDMKVISSYKPL